MYKALHWATALDPEAVGLGRGCWAGTFFMAAQTAQAPPGSID